MLHVNGQQENNLLILECQSYGESQQMLIIAIFVWKIHLDTMPKISIT